MSQRGASGANSQHNIKPGDYAAFERSGKVSYCGVFCCFRGLRRDSWHSTAATQAQNATFRMRKPL